MQKVHITCENDGRTFVDAEVVGPFAVHRGVGFNRDTYVVTHLFTGLRLFPRSADNDNYEPIHAMHEAIDIAKRAWAVANWYFDAELIQNDKEFRSEVKQALVDAGLY